MVPGSSATSFCQEPSTSLVHKLPQYRTVTCWGVLFIISGVAGFLLRGRGLERQTTPGAFGIAYQACICAGRANHDQTLWASNPSLSKCRESWEYDLMVLVTL